MRKYPADGGVCILCILIASKGTPFFVWFLKFICTKFYVVKVWKKKIQCRIHFRWMTLQCNTCLKNQSCHICRSEKLSLAKALQRTGLVEQIVYWDRPQKKFDDTVTAHAIISLPTLQSLTCKFWTQVADKSSKASLRNLLFRKLWAQIKNERKGWSALDGGRREEVLKNYEMREYLHSNVTLRLVCHRWKLKAFQMLFLLHAL